LTYPVLFELSDLAAVKQSGGLNNDWDLTGTVIDLLYSLTARPAIYKSREPWARWQETLKQCDVTGMAEYLAATDQPLATLLKQSGKPRDDFISGLYAGDVGSGNIIKQLFQEIYLGHELFKSTYNIKPQIYTGNGYILREKVLIDRSVLEALGRDNMLAIATGRPRAEAEYPLKYFDLQKYFNVIYTLDDCLQAEEKILAEKGEKVSLSKPHPFMLDAIADGFKDKFSGYYYIGDMPDDILAAANSRFGFKSIGVTVSAPDKLALEKELKRAGAEYLVENFDALTEIIL
jgi:phosphoglycolate phosphatase-like HAD superfamily hydrolase